MYNQYGITEKFKPPLSYNDKSMEYIHLLIGLTNDNGIFFQLEQSPLYQYGTFVPNIGHLKDMTEYFKTMVNGTAEKLKEWLKKEEKEENEANKDSLQTKKQNIGPFGKSIYTDTKPLIIYLDNNDVIDKLSVTNGGLRKPQKTIKTRRNKKCRVSKRSSYAKKTKTRSKTRKM